MPSFEEYKSRVEDEIKNNKVVLYMRGTPEAPRCGFSARAAGVFEQLGVNYHSVDLDSDRPLWQALSKINNWPTSPQIFVNGEFVGGCDNVIEMWESGELQQLLQQ
jgi:monothiol glutaredoxin